MKNKALTPYEIAVQEVFNASVAVRQAMSNFNNATPEYFIIANQELTTAQQRYSIAVQKVKMLG